MMSEKPAITVSLEALTLKDSIEVYRLYTNEEVLQSYPVKPIAKKDETDDFIIRITTNGCWSWKIARINEPNSFLGICSLHHYDESNKSIEIGGTLLPEFWGKNIMNQTFQILINLAVKKFDIKKVIGKTHTTNYKAVKLVKKMGFEVLTSNEEETVLYKILL